MHKRFVLFVFVCENNGIMECISKVCIVIWCKMTKERERGGENDRDVVIDSRIRKEKEKDREREKEWRGASLLGLDLPCSNTLKRERDTHQILIYERIGGIQRVKEQQRVTRRLSTFSHKSESNT